MLLILGYTSEISDFQEEHSHLAWTARLSIAKGMHPPGGEFTTTNFLAPSLYGFCRQKRKRKNL